MPIAFVRFGALIFPLTTPSAIEFQSFAQDHTTTKVRFDINTVTLNWLVLWKMHFKLRNTLPTWNMQSCMLLFTPDMRIRIPRYKTLQDIADDYFADHLELYSDHKSVMECNMEYYASLMKNKSRFIQAVFENTIDLLGCKQFKSYNICTGRDGVHKADRSYNTIKMDNAVAKWGIILLRGAPWCLIVQEIWGNGSWRLRVIRLLIWG